MERIPEPELMDTRNQVLAYVEGDFSKGEKEFIDFINSYLITNKINLSEKDLILDLGCGPGNITERLSLQWPYVNIIGIDGSKEMINEAMARKNLSKNKQIFKNINYFFGDIKKLELKNVSSKKRVSLVVSNSLIHHVTNIDQFFDCIINLSAKETINFHKDLTRPKDEKTALLLKEKCSQIYSSTLSNDYYASLKASYRKDEIKKIIDLRRFDSLDVTEDSNGYLILYGKV
tara:strand:- start:2373 stop:3068 length:696 start_codon:yes stop_codon:yes gene_type:complete